MAKSIEQLSFWVASHSALKFTVFYGQREGSLPYSQELIMINNNRECKGAFGTGLHAQFLYAFTAPVQS
jgi:hypothetical protein